MRDNLYTNLVLTGIATPAFYFTGSHGLAVIFGIMLGMTVTDVLRRLGWVA